MVWRVLGESLHQHKSDRYLCNENFRQMTLLS